MYSIKKLLKTIKKKNQGTSEQRGEFQEKARNLISDEWLLFIERKKRAYKFQIKKPLCSAQNAAKFTFVHVVIVLVEPHFLVLVYGPFVPTKPELYICSSRRNLNYAFINPNSIGGFAKFWGKSAYVRTIIKPISLFETALVMTTA